MKNNKGFTLTEILLAAMVVGIIGVALAAITTAGVREGKIGRTKAILRNQLSVAMRQVRQDIEESSSVTVSNDKTLTLTKNQAWGPDSNFDATPVTVVYQFTDGSVESGGGYTGGTLTRAVNGGSAEVILYNVKSISNGTFVSPSFALDFASLVRVRIIVEVAGKPVVNDVVDETFLLPQGIIIPQN